MTLDDNLPREYQLRITEHLFRRIEHLLSYMKHKNLEPSTKPSWILHAIEELLEEEGHKVEGLAHSIQQA